MNFQSKQKYTLFFLLVLTGLIGLAGANWSAAPSGVVQDDGDSSQQEAPDEEMNDSDEDADGESDAEKDEDAKDDDKEETYLDNIKKAIEPVDKQFGKWIVDPLAGFFFFDFYTGPRYLEGREYDDENENGEYDEGEKLYPNEIIEVTSASQKHNLVTDDEGKWKVLESKGWLGVKIPFVVIWLLFGALYLTAKMAFINVRAFFHAIALTKGDYDDPAHDGEVSHFQALSSALSATVGLGNIAGVAIAIGAGGPGATFWMVVIGLLGMSSKFTECTLGQMYRKVDPQTGRVSGGPMRYLKEGLKELGIGWLGTILAVIFALLCIGASLGGGNSFQVGQSLDAIRADESLTWLDANPWIYGLVMAVAVGVVIIGGIKAIGKVASRIVPFMCAAYVLMALYIIFTNISKVGPAFQMIFENAFNMQAGMGAILGVMVVGIQRAVFSNEAGVGSAAIAHSAAKTEEPVSEGIVALLEPFIDTVVICTMTAIVIIIAGGEWNATTGEKDILGQNFGAWTNTDYGQYVSGENKSGAALTVSAVSGEFGVPWFRYVLYAAVVLFAYSTLISWYYYGERCWTSLFGEWSSGAFKLLFLVFTVLGSIVTTGKILDFSDLLILSMALPNILGMYILSGKVKQALDEYWEKKKAGKLGPKKPQ